MEGMSELTTQNFSFNKARALVIGDVMLDRYVFGKVSRISPEAPIPILRKDKEEIRPGGAANVAANMNELGVGTTLLSVTGADAAAEVLSEAVGCKAFFIKQKGRPTIEKIRFVSHKHQMLRVDTEDTSEITEDTTNELLKAAKNQFRTADVVVLVDYGKGCLTSSFVKKLVKSSTVPVLVGLKSHDISKYRGATAVFLNKQESFEYTGKRDVVEAGKALIKELSLRFAVITRGDEGVTVISAKEVFTQPTVARDVYDVTGAGDTFLAAFAAAYANSLPVQECARIANTAAGIKVSRFGAVAVGIGEVNQALSGTEPNKKIVSFEDLSRIASQARRSKKRIVFTNGCFDIIHNGHIETLKFASAQGDVLIVGINSDASIKRLKGNSRPVMTLEHRARVLAAMEYVDYVVAFEDDTPEKLIEGIQPDVLVKGADWAGKKVVGEDFVTSYGGQVKFAPIVQGMSTSAIIDKINAKK